MNWRATKGPVQDKQEAFVVQSKDIDKNTISVINK